MIGALHEKKTLVGARFLIDRERAIITAMSLKIAADVAHHGLDRLSGLLIAERA